MRLTHAWLDDVACHGLAFEPLPDGSMRGRADTLRWRRLRLQRGGIQIAVPQIALHGARWRFGGSPLTLLGLHADELRIEGAELQLTPRAGVAPGTAGTPWRFDALAGLTGLLRAFIEDAAWIVDADISMPLEGGRLDFDRVVVEHVGPNSVMGVGSEGIYLEAPNRMRSELLRFVAASMPGVTAESRETRFLVGSRVTDRGALALQPFVEACLGAAAGQPRVRLAGREIEGMLARTRLDGELRLGDGALGRVDAHLVLERTGPRSNRADLTAAVVGQRVVVRIGELAASGAVFELFGLPGRTGALSADVELQVHGLGGPGTGVEAGVSGSLHQLRCERIELGSVE